jgi:hypothetical protein
MKRLLSHEINFHPQSFSDDMMKVFLLEWTEI